MTESDPREREQTHAGDPPGPPPVADSAGRSPFSLSPRQRSVASELDRIDPQLGGLYRLGLEFSGRESEPGASYILAIVGRELNRGVMNRLALDAPALRDDEAAAIDPNEKHRETFARALRVSPGHPLVTALAEMNRRFSGEAKFSPNRRGGSSAFADFRTLVDLIAGRIAPYFEAQDDADRLLAAVPAPEHADLLRRVMVRPALRTYFLRAATHSGWLGPLRELGSFANAPSRIVHLDGGWSTQGWLEGEYLVRIAAQEPRRVSELLLAVPSTNDNPAVWDLIARASIAMEPQLAAVLLRHIIRGIRAVPRVVVTRSFIEVGRHVASVEPDVVLDLMDSLLWLHRIAPVSDGAGDDEPVDAARYSASWLLARVDEHDVEEILKGLVPALATADPGGTVKLLREKLALTMRSVDRRADERTARETIYWCESFDDDTNGRDLRSMFARSLFAAATAQASKSEEAAQSAVVELRQLPIGIASRLVDAVVAIAGPFLRAEVDRLLADTEVLDREPSGHETGTVLRSRFLEASDEAQEAFARTLERGPDDENIDAMARWFEETGQPRDRAAIIDHWQARHLRRFGLKLPTAVQPLAERLGFAAREINPEDLALTEMGSYSGGHGGMVFDQSPISDERLQGGAINDVAQEIATWVPAGGIDRPTLRGLNDAMERLASKDPVRGASLALSLIATARTPHGVSGVLWGLRNARRSEEQLPWDLVGEIALSAIGAIGDAHDQEWADVRIAAVDLLEDAIDDAPATVAREAFDAARRAVDQPAVWIPRTDDDATTIEGVISASLNTEAGRLVRLVIRLALRNYHLERGDATDDDPRASVIRHRIGDQLHQAVEVVLRQHGNLAIAARATLGTFLPQLIWFAPDWWERRGFEALQGGITERLRNPVWPVYLARSSFFNRAFSTLRSWYAEAAQNAGTIQAHERSRDWEPDRHLIEHVLVAVVRGLASVGDADLLVETAVDRVPVDDLGHAYWTFFRAWTDAKKRGQAVPETMAHKLVGFWEWRLDRLETQEGAARIEEASHLLWFLRTPFIPTADVTRLGRRTLGLVRSPSRHIHLSWERIAELSAHDPDGAFTMYALAVEIELESDYRHFDMDEIAPVFENAFARGTADTRAAATALLHRLGDAGFPDFRRFLP